MPGSLTENYIRTLGNKTHKEIATKTIQILNITTDNKMLVYTCLTHSASRTKINADMYYLILLNIFIQVLILTILCSLEGAHHLSLQHIAGHSATQHSIL